MMTDARELAQRCNAAERALVSLGDHAFGSIAADIAEAAALLIKQAEEIERLKEWIANPPRHEFWGPNDPDRPKDNTTPNGELWRPRCKKCGIDMPGDQICRGVVERNEVGHAD